MKTTIITILIGVVLILGFLLLKKERTVPVDNSWPETVPARATNETQTNTEPDKQNDPVTPPLVGVHTFEKSNGNPSARATVRHAIIAAEIRYETENKVCGNGNEFVAPCGIYLEDYQQKIEKVAEWPNAAVYQKYPEIFSPYNPSTSIGQAYFPNNFYQVGALNLDGDNVMFDTKIVADDYCGYFDIQHWRYDLKTNQFHFMSKTTGPRPTCS